ncbi:hypothetical protein QL285_044804 [Trifolium repens]|nr:hypothetical protein QL285_044804 [Trifolium repens]
MQSRLASWKTRLLNKPGRLALTSSVLTSIPNYYMQITWLPQSICDSIDQASRNFIWKNANNKGIHLVSWTKMSKPKKLGGLGLRSARDANICLLGKLVWDILLSKDKLWVNIFSQRYDAGIKILQASDQQGISPTWSSIIRAKKSLREGFTRRADSGSSSFWLYPWSILGCFSKLVPYIDIHNFQLTVKDVLNSNNPHSQILYTNLSHTALDITNNTHTMFNDQLYDTFIWADNKNGVYTTKSGYDWILSRTEQPDQQHHYTWTWIWKLKAPEKIKLLIWLTCHNSVPTLALLHHRNMAPSSACPRCGHHKETFLHCAKDCPSSSTIWHHMGFTADDFFAASTVHDWLKENYFRPRSYFFLASLWWIWRLRNLMCLNNEKWSTVCLSFNIHSMVELLKVCFPPTPNNNSTDRFITSNNNNYPGIILNVDGSCLGTPPRSGFGCIIRNNGGLVLTGASGFISGLSDILLAELSAIFHGLKLAKDMGLAELSCYTDSLTCL